MQAAFQSLGLTVLERGWLSSNSVVFRSSAVAPATVVDTGYVAHAAQTVALVRAALGPERLRRVINTHLHSDHCGGNAALQAEWDCDVWVPAWSFAAASRWAESELSFAYTGQRCERFRADAVLRPGQRFALGTSEAWQAIAAPGHDPEALMLFEPNDRVLLSADALWENRLAIVFPEVVGQDGFGAVRATLDRIRQLEPRIVIPGHGAPFTDVQRALGRSGEILASFEADAAKHARYAARALVMFRMLEVRRAAREDLVAWIVRTPVYADLRAGGQDQTAPGDAADTIIDGLVAAGHLHVLPASGDIAVPA